MYDRAADPGEARNLIGTHALKQQKAVLEQRLLDWYINTGGTPLDTRNSRDVPAFTPPQAPAIASGDLVRALDS